MKKIQYYKAIVAQRFIRNVSAQKGFTLVEFLLVMAIFAVLAGIATVNLFTFQRQSQLNASLDIFIADLKEQQMKAMSGDAAGESTVENYGINFDSANYRYVLFKGTYSAANAANFAIINGNNNVS
jgi:prepilin-type N-terminal cleavage/methylation domain-containing protein